MLILAGVSLNAIVGKNGILTRAQDAVAEYKVSENREQRQLNSIFGTSNSINTVGVLELERYSALVTQGRELQDNQGYSVGLDSSGNILAADTENNVLYTINQNGEIVNEIEIQMSPENIFDFNSSTGEITDIKFKTGENCYYDYGWGCKDIHYIYIPKEIGGKQVRTVKLATEDEEDGYHEAVTGLDFVIVPNGVTALSRVCLNESKDGIPSALILPSTVTTLNTGIRGGYCYNYVENIITPTRLTNSKGKAFKCWYRFEEYIITKNIRGD